MLPGLHSVSQEHSIALFQKTAAEIVVVAAIAADRISFRSYRSVEKEESCWYLIAAARVKGL